jgi:hypothetical protein
MNVRYPTQTPKNRKKALEDVQIAQYNRQTLAAYQAFKRRMGVK